MAKILIVEDEVNVSSFIRKGLEEEGHSVDYAYDGAMGLSLACTREYDVIILDIILPQMNGLEVCQRVRERLGYNVQILMLTALGTSEDIVKGLEMGADDYIAKPFRFKELLARINAMLRRRGSSNISKIYSFSDLELDTETKIVTRAGRKIQLTSKEFRLLEFFMANPRRVLSRTTIIENVWDSASDYGTNIVEVYIKYLRDKIDKGFQGKLIHTVVGMGYVLKESMD
ncbi:MAG: response regulator transcription factor [Bacteroidota bacterium]|nr:response regulator transcription factor [Bacteroidota bacterium]